jgi:hypothetical protein
MFVHVYDVAEQSLYKPCVYYESLNVNLRLLLAWVSKQLSDA